MKDMEQKSNISLVRFKHLEKDLFPEIAELHIDNIPTGFISSLGLDFVTTAYRAIEKDQQSFGFAALEGDKLLGFISFSNNLRGLYRVAALEMGTKFGSVLLKKLFSFSMIKKIMDDVFYPFKADKLNLPKAELLSIVVVPESRGKGIAGRLVEAGLNLCKTRGIDRVKVLVAAENEPANKLYQKYGFEFKIKIYNHGIRSNIYVVELNEKPETNDQDVFAQILKKQGYKVLEVNGIYWYEYQGFIMPAYLPHCQPKISEEMTKKVLKLTKGPFARWDSNFGQLENSQWWYVLKRGPWAIEDIKNKKKRWMIRQGKKRFFVRPLGFDEVIAKCPTVARLATARYKGHTEIESEEMLASYVAAAEKIPGVLEYIGCFHGDILVGFSENYIQKNAVWLANIRNDPAYLNEYSSYSLMDGILDYYLNQKKMDYVLDGCRSIHHKTSFQEHLTKVFGFTKEYAILNVKYSAGFKIAVKLAYPFKDFFWMLSDKWINAALDNISAVLRQEYIRSSCVDL